MLEQEQEQVEEQVQEQEVQEQQVQEEVQEEVQEQEGQEPTSLLSFQPAILSSMTSCIRKRTLEHTFLSCK